MSFKQFLSDDAKRRATEVIQSVELKTSAELVVSVRARSGDYRAPAYLFGFGVLFLTLLVLTVLPITFTNEAILLDALTALFVAVLLALTIRPLHRRLVRRATLAQNSATQAHALFYELGISRTSGRNGILVFVSLFEQQCVVVPDIGVDEEFLGEPWQALQASLDAAVQRLDLDAFVAALERMGPLLGAAMPRCEDDVNELSDEVR